MDGFGASAPAPKLYEHFGITAGQGRARLQGKLVERLMDLDKLKTTAGIDLKGKRVLVRADLNVPVKDGKVTDATRLERLVPGLQDLAKRGAARHRHLAFRPAEGRPRSADSA